MIMFVLAIVYALCGFLVYGMYKGEHRLFCQYFENMRYTREHELTACKYGFLGFFGLTFFWTQKLVVFMCLPALPSASGFVFCIRMPKEFLAPRAVRVRQEK